MILKVEKSENVHHQFQKLLTDLNKPTDDYELNIANRLYGDTKFQFLQVSFTGLASIHLHSGPSVPSKQTGDSEADDPD